MPLDFPAFRPHPLVRGGHLQTIFGAYLPSRVQVSGAQHRVPLADGDVIVLHEDRAAECVVGPTCVAVLAHGLGGCAESPYMLRCSAKLRNRGVRVFRMDLRGCGAGMALARHSIHAGRSDDVAAVLAFLMEKWPGAPIHLVGFSMGANIVLKLAGELGRETPSNLASVMAVSPPIDLNACSQNLARGFNRLYDRKFVKGLLNHVRRRSSLVADAHSRPLVPRPRRLIDFDDCFTAPLAGFSGVHDYYTRASSAPLLNRISVPTLIVAAASDPIIPVRVLEQASYSPTTQLVITPCGGHLGFIAANGDDADRRWLDWRVVDWVMSHGRPVTTRPSGQ